METLQGFTQVTTDRVVIDGAIPTPQTVTLDLGGIKTEKSHSFLALELRGSLIADVGALDLPPEAIDQLCSSISLQFDKGRSSIIISGASLSKLLNLVQYRRRNKTSQLLTVGDDTQFRHVFFIPLVGTMASLTFKRRARVMGTRLEKETLSVTFNAADFAGVIATSNMEVILYSDAQPVLADDATVITNINIAEQTDIKSSNETYPGADIIVMSRAPIPTNQLPAPLAATFQTFWLPGTVDVPLEPQEYIVLSQQDYMPPQRFDDVITAYSDLALAIHPQITAGARQNVGVFKAFDRRDHKGFRANVNVQLNTKNSAIPLGIITEASIVPKGMN